LPTTPGSPVLIFRPIVSGLLVTREVPCRVAAKLLTCIVLRGVGLRSYAAYAAFASTRGLRNSSHHWRKVVSVLESGVRGSAVSSP
jgi:hypothetical protein